MLFHIEADIDYPALGDRKQELLRAEWSITQRLIDQRIALGEWRKADATGIIAVWDLPDRATLDAIIESLPLRPYLTRLVIRELAEHPLFPGGRLT